MKENFHYDISRLKEIFLCNYIGCKEVAFYLCIGIGQDALNDLEQTCVFTVELGREGK